MNTFGNIFRVEIFGESHGPALGCTLDGLPAGFQPDFKDIVFELSRRRPRQSIESTARREADSFEILSGFFRGRFTGMPLTAVFRNSDAKPVDYCGTAARPSHADYAANRKYSGYNDPRGGGAFSGKDCSKVDRSAAYAARYAAKNIVAAGLADKCEIQLSYAIGVAQPTSVMVDTFGTGKLSDEKITEIVRENFDLRPAGIIKMLDLRRPIYKQTAAYGHFGRNDLDLPWEKLDKVDTLKKYL